MLKLKAWNSVLELLVRNKHTRVQAFFEIQPLRRWKRDKFSFFFLPKDNHIFIEVREFGICKQGILYKNKNEQTNVFEQFLKFNSQRLFKQMIINVALKNAFIAQNY